MHATLRDATLHYTSRVETLYKNNGRMKWRPGRSIQTTPAIPYHTAVLQDHTAKTRLSYLPQKIGWYIDNKFKHFREPTKHTHVLCTAPLRTTKEEPVSSRILPFGWSYETDHTNFRKIIHRPPHPKPIHIAKPDTIKGPTYPFVDNLQT